MDAFTPAGFDRNEYGMKTWQKIFYILLGMLLIGVAAIGCVTYAYAQQTHLPVLLVPLMFLAMGIYTIALAARSMVIIEGTRIQVQSAFRERSAEVSGIEGFRTFSTRYGRVLQFRLKDGLGTINVPGYFDTDDYFRKWTEQVTDLDQSGRHAILDEISREESLGATPEERLKALTTAKTWGIFLLIVAIATDIGLFVPDLVPRLPLVLILALIPVIAILLVLRSPLLYTVFKPKADPRAELGYALLACSLGLLIPVAGLHLVSLQPLLLVIVPVSLAYCAALFNTVQKNAISAGIPVVLLMLACAYSYCLGVAADTLEDAAQVTRYTTSVAGKHTSSGRSTSYILVLAPWGPVQSANQINVSRSTYRQTEIGDQVCLDLHPGTLKAPWYQAANCSYPPGTHSMP